MLGLFFGLRTYPNYDSYYQLLWGQDLAHGRLPDYNVFRSPTPHPLSELVGLALAPFGLAADRLLVLITLVTWVGLLWAVYRFTKHLLGTLVAAVAVLVMLTRTDLEFFALRGVVDIWFLFLVFTAAAMEVHRPRRGMPVMLLLVLAGLLRPEAWVLSGLYVLWIWRDGDARSRAISVALAASAPLIWAGSDWAVTGDPLHSMHGTADLAVANDRRRSLGDVPYWTAKYFGYVLREPLVLGVPIGLVFAWLYARKRAVLPLAVVVAMVAVFAVGPLFGLPLIRRYVATPAVLLTLFYGLAVAGWTMLPRGRARTGWTAVGALAVLLSVAYLPWQYDLLRTVERRLDKDGVLYGDLQQAMEAPQVRAAFAACPDLTAGDHRPMPYARFWLDGAPGSVTTVEGGASPMGKLLLMPVKGPSTRRIYPPGVFPKVKTPDGFTTIYENRSWRVSAAPGCV